MSHHHPDILKELKAASLSKRFVLWSRHRLLLTILICQLLFFGGLLALAWQVGGHHRAASNASGGLLRFHDDPVSLARHQSQQTLQPQQASSADPWAASQQWHAGQQGDPLNLSTLILYIFSPTDPEYLNNLMYFVREGMKPNDGCDYVFVVNQAVGEEMASFSAMANLAGSLPPNARYLTHPNECYDWGTLGWLLAEGKVDVSGYKYILFINSSVRGPFLPAYWPQRVHWSRVFTDRLNNETKLVGPTISCEGIQPVGMPERKNPHVQSFVVATDKVGLRLLMADNNVFRCYDHIHLTMFHSELGASKVILDAGYNIDSLMKRYQGVDWHDKSQWGCNANESPYKESHYDGINVDPLEVLFVKVKQPLLELRYSASLKARKYDEWSANMVAAASEQQRRPRDVSSNSYQVLPADFRPVVLTGDGKSATGKCFDIGFYKQVGAPSRRTCPATPSPVEVAVPPPQMSPELNALDDHIALQHFAARGQFEGRHFRFVDC